MRHKLGAKVIFFKEKNKPFVSFTVKKISLFVKNTPMIWCLF